MTEDPGDKVDVGAEIKRALRLLVVASVVLYLGLAITGVVQFSIARTSREVAKTSRDDADRLEQALCSLRSDLEVRVASSRAFLEQYPDGIPGISPKLIQDGIDNQQRTIIALKDLHC